MTDPLAPPPSPSLQFDRAVITGTPAHSGVTCSQCRKPIADAYFTLARKTFRASCKAGVDQTVAATRTPAAFAVTTQRLLLVIAGVGVYRAFTPAGDRTDRRTLATFVALVVALTALSAIRVNT